MEKFLHSNYIYKCAKGLWILKDLTNFPLELTYLIINLKWRLRSEPVLLLLDIGDSINFGGIIYQWDVIVKCVREIYPNFRTFNKMFNNHKELDCYMKNLRCVRIFKDDLSSEFFVPFCLLIPGSLWDQNEDILRGMRILYQKWVFGCRNIGKHKSDHSKVGNFEEFFKWVTNELYDSSFLMIQNQST